MKKALKITVITILLLAALAMLGLSYYTGRSAFKGICETVSREQTLENQSYYTDEYKKFAANNKPVEIMIPSRQNDSGIPALYVEKPESKGVAVLIHGMGGTKKSSYRMMRNFLDLGYSVISYDQRNSGDNTAPYNTCGVLESIDALDVVDFARENLLNSGKLILWGESYGGATAAIAAGRDDSGIDCLILESPMGRGIDMFKTVAKEYAGEAGIPLSYITFCADVYMKIKLGFGFKEMDPSAWIKSTSKPVLISNSSIDELVPLYMGEEIYEAVGHEKKRIFTNDKYGHAEFPSKDPRGYKRLIEEFIKDFRA